MRRIALGRIKVIDATVKIPKAKMNQSNLVQIVSAEPFIAADFSIVECLPVKVTGTIIVLLVQVVITEPS